LVIPDNASRRHGPIQRVDGGWDTRLMLVIAHAGHWIESLLILLPTVAFIVWLVIVTMRDRRRERQKQ
jgi:hypothetical protein